MSRRSDCERKLRQRVLNVNWWASNEDKSMSNETREKPLLPLAGGNAKVRDGDFSSFNTGK